MPNNFQKYYARIIAIFFVLVSLSLFYDLYRAGYSAETWHKAFHVILGLSIVKFGWNNKNFWKPFCIVNGAFFLYVGLFGFSFPNFGGLATFNRTDSILHIIVGLFGIVAYFSDRIR